MQSVIVTGGSGGIGQAICRTLATGGYAVVNLDPAPCPALVEELQAAGARFMYRSVDVGNRAQVEAAAAEAEEQFGPLWGLVNCAGINEMMPFLEATDENFDLLFHVNFRGMFVCSQVVARRMVPRRQGRIVNILSTSSVLGFNHHAVYDATKGACQQLTCTMAVELGPLGIQVNGVAPGTIVTQATADWLAQGRIARHDLERVPLGRYGRPQDIANAVAFLISPRATWINGATLFVDGGHSITGMPAFGPAGEG